MTSRAAIVAGLALVAPACAQNALRFEKVLSNRDTIFGYYAGRGAVSLDGDNAAFVAVREGAHVKSMVRWRIGTTDIHSVAVERTELPDGNGRFTSFNLPPSIDGDDLAFHAFTDHPSQGQFSELGGELMMLGWLARFGGYPQVSEGRVLFTRDAGTPYREMFLRDADGTTRTLVQFGDTSPDGSEFRGINAVPIIQGQQVVFAGSTELDAGAYRYDLTTWEIEQIISRSTPVPGYDETFNGVGPLDVNGDELAFFGSWPDGGDGVFLERGGEITLVVDDDTPLPDGSGNFRLGSWKELSIAYDGGVMLFEGRRVDGERCIYAAAGGTLRHVLEPGYAIDGKIATEYHWNSMSLDGNTSLVALTFDDGELALYRATFPACPQDFDGNGSVDTRDLIVYLNAWSAGDTAADFNGDQKVDTRDVLAFLNGWGTGC